MRQGDVYWASLPEPIGDRLVIILTRTDSLRKLSNVTVVPLTTIFRDVPAEVAISTACGLAKDSIANMDNMMTIPKSDLRDRTGGITAGELDEIMQTIHYVFDMPF